MNGLRKSIRSMAVLLSLACAVTVSGCQRENNPSGGLVSESMEVSSLVLDSEVGSQTSSEEPPVTSAEESQSSSAMSSMVSTSTAQADPSSISEDAPSQVESSQSGESITEIPTIPFTVRACYDFGGYHPSSDASAQVITSMAELKEKFGYSEAIKLYNDSFFHDHVIIKMVQQHRSASYRERIDSITRSDQKLIIDYTLLQPTELLDAGTSHSIWLDVSKSDTEGITEVVLQPHVKKLEEYSDLKAENPLKLDWEQE